MEFYGTTFGGKVPELHNGSHRTEQLWTEEHNTLLSIRSAATVLALKKLGLGRRRRVHALLISRRRV